MIETHRLKNVIIFIQTISEYQTGIRDRCWCNTHRFNKKNVLLFFFHFLEKIIFNTMFETVKNIW